MSKKRAVVVSEHQKLVFWWRRDRCLPAYQVQLGRALLSVPGEGRAKTKATVRSPILHSFCYRELQSQTQGMADSKKWGAYKYLQQALLHTDRCWFQRITVTMSLEQWIFFFQRQAHSLAWALPSWLGWLTSKSKGSTCLCLPSVPPHPGF